MLSAGSSAVNQFGTVLVTPQAVAVSRAPTAQPTSTPFSDGHKNTHALAIGLGVGLGGGGLLIIMVLAIYVWRSRQNNKLVPPVLTNGRSMPLAGAHPLTTSRFNAACMQIMTE